MGELFPKRRRNRLTLVCRRCRIKKNKCDRRLPCDQCIRAECSRECTYDLLNRAANSPAPSEFGSMERIRPIILQQLEFSKPPSPGEPWHPQHRADSVTSVTSATSATSANSDTLGNPRLKYMIGEKPSVSSSDMLNMRMSLAQFDSVPVAATGSEDLSGIEPPGFVELRFSSLFTNLKLSLRGTFMVELSQQDPAGRLYWEQDAVGEKINLMTIQNLGNSLRNCVLKAASKHFGPLFLSSNRLDRAATRKQLSMYGSPLGFLYTPGYTDGDSYQASLRKLLPSKKCILAYLERFFSKIYPMYPIVDELSIFSQVDRLFNFSGAGAKYVSANLASRDDVIMVATILFMLRLSHLSFLTNIRAHNEAILNSVYVGDLLLKDSPISLDVVDLATAMLQKGNPRSRSQFVLLQAHTLKLIHQLTSLENETSYCDIDGVSGIGALLSLSVSLMMERDPDHIANFPSDPKQRNLRRKVWYTLLQLEYTILYLFLTPRTITANEYKTKLPSFDPRSANIRDLEMEQRAINQLCELHEVLCAGDKVLDLAADMTQLVSATVLNQRIHDFECLVEQKLGLIDDYFVKRNSGHKHDVLLIAKLKVLLCVRMFVSYVNLFMSIYYRYKRNQRLGFHFLKKAVLIHMTEFSYLCSELMFCQEDYFDTSFALMLSPVVIIIRQGSNIVSLILSIALTCDTIVHGISEDKSRDVHLLKELLMKFRRCNLLVQQLVKLFSERYYCAWKFVRINSYGNKRARSDGFFMVGFDKLQRGALLFTDVQIADLMSCIREELPIEISDPESFREQCYQGVECPTDEGLEGLNLYKSLQTDNFWIIVSTHAEREYASLYLSNDLLSLPEYEESSSHGQENGTSRKHNLCVLDPITNVDIEPSTLQILDLNMFSANWRKDTLPEDGVPSGEDIL